MDACCENAEENRQEMLDMKGEKYEVDDVWNLAICSVSEELHSDSQTVVQILSDVTRRNIL